MRPTPPPINRISEYRLQQRQRQSRNVMTVAIVSSTIALLITSNVASFFLGSHYTDQKYKRAILSVGEAIQERWGAPELPPPQSNEKPLRANGDTLSGM